MTTYRGPNVQVTQQFITSPAAVAIEDLPSAVVGTAYDVYDKEKIGTAFGIIGNHNDVHNDIVWPNDNVIYDESVAGKRVFEFYPAKSYARGSLGDIEMEMADGEFNATGVRIDRDKRVTISGTEKVAGSCNAIIPYYKKNHGTSSITIAATDLSTVVAVGASFLTSQVKPGQKVFISIDGGSTYLDIGTVGAAVSSETRLRLAKPYTGAIADGDAIIIGAAAITATINDIPDIFYDADADFIASKVRVGDIIAYESLSMPDSIDAPRYVSIVSVLNKNTLRISTDDPAARETVNEYTNMYYKKEKHDYDFINYAACVEAQTDTIPIYQYEIQRFVGFSENYGLRLMGTTTGAIISSVNTDTYKSFKYLKTIVTASPKLKVGDFMIFTDANPTGSTVERDYTYLQVYRVKTITEDATHYLVTTDEAMNRSDADATPIADGDFLSAWTPKIEQDVIVDFRSIREQEAQVVKRFAQVKDITDAWTSNGEISIYNELAYMAYILFTRSGGKVGYGVNVNAAATSLAQEYSEALELLKLKDVYSHAIGTTDAGVNGIMADYCNGQSEPYEAHERIAVLAYDQDDVFKMGEDTLTDVIPATGLIKIAGDFDPMTAGLTVGDKVKIYDSSDTFVDEVTVIETPTVATQVQTDYDGSELAATHYVVFLNGRADAQSVLIGGLGLGERRVSIVWPGWFYGEFNGSRILLPPYYISASIAGMDGGIIVSQSFTNMPFSLPGISNIQLDTNTIYRKAQLDEMGGGGVDIMIQDATITQTIKSRHDLTTNMDSVEYRERSITKQADMAAKTIRAAVAPYIGRYNITPDLFRFLGSICSIVCTTLVKKGILSRLDLQNISRDEVIADKVNFSFEATVFVAGNYYDITLIVKSI